MSTRLATCSHCILSICNLFISHFGFKSGIWLLIAPGHVYCFSITLTQENGEACIEIQRRRYDELSLKMCTDSVWRESVGNDNVNYFYWASAITMPELVEINLVSHDDDLLTDRK